MAASNLLFGGLSVKLRADCRPRAAFCPDRSFFQQQNEATETPSSPSNVRLFAPTVSATRSAHAESASALAFVTSSPKRRKPVRNRPQDCTHWQEWVRRTLMLLATKGGPCRSYFSSVCKRNASGILRELCCILKNAELRATSFTLPCTSVSSLRITMTLELHPRRTRQSGVKSGDVGFSQESSMSHPTPYYAPYF